MSVTYKQNKKFFILCPLFFFISYMSQKNKQTNLLCWKLCLLSCWHQLGLLLPLSLKSTVPEGPSNEKGEQHVSVWRQAALRRCPTQSHTQPTGSGVRLEPSPDSTLALPQQSGRDGKIQKYVLWSQMAWDRALPPSLSCGVNLVKLPNLFVSCLMYQI